VPFEDLADAGIDAIHEVPEQLADVINEFFCPRSGTEKAVDTGRCS
jgi:hypothetical protein